jgi:hypothetical protein
MKNKKTGAKTYIGIAVAAVVAFFLAHPSWLPLPEAARESIAAEEKNHLIVSGVLKTTLAQLVTLVLALLIVWLVYTVLKLLLGVIGKKSKRV